MNININEIVKTIREEGYIRIENFINAEVSKEIEDFMHSFNKDNYNKENLLERICFKREEHLFFLCRRGQLRKHRL